MRWLFVLVLAFFAIIFLRGVYRELLRDPTMAWLTRERHMEYPWWVIEQYVNASARWPRWALPATLLVHLVGALLGSIRQAPFPASGQADKWAGKSPWGRYWRWHLRNWLWDLRADWLGARWTPEHWWRDRKRVVVTEWGGGYQEWTLRLWQLKALPILVLPFVEWRTDRGNFHVRHGLPNGRFHMPWLPSVKHRWHAGWQDGRTLNIEMRVHRQ